MTFDDKAAVLLDAAQGDPSNFDELVNYLAAQVAAARNTILYPDQKGASSNSMPSRVLADAYRVETSQTSTYPADPSETSTNIDAWQRLIQDLEAVAHALERSFAALTGDHSAMRRSMQRQRSVQTITALRLWMLAKFCQVRAQVNQDAIAIEVFEDYPRKKKLRPRDAVDRFENARREYERRVRKAEVTRVLGHGEWQAGDALAFELWRGEFGRPRDAELGWGGVSRSVRVILRYHRYRKRFVSWWLALWHLTSSKTGIQGFLGNLVWVPIRVLWALVRLPVAFVRAAAILLLKLLTHLALRPERFAFITFMTIPIFTLLYLADDLPILNHNSPPCHGVLWSLYYAVVNLTSLGANEPACGPYTNTIVSIESLTGYFLLSVLAAMFFSWLTDR